MRSFSNGDENKEMKGDSEAKLSKAVAESDVVIVNPTHFAVALKYDSQVTASPMVNAKGEDNTAFTIRRIAAENNISIVENPPLARDLYTNLEVGDTVPDVYYNAIAEIYSHLEKSKNFQK